jgi:hypothetical protein
MADDLLLHGIKSSALTVQSAPTPRFSPSPIPRSRRLAEVVASSWAHSPRRHDPTHRAVTSGGVVGRGRTCTSWGRPQSTSVVTRRLRGGGRVRRRVTSGPVIQMTREEGVGGPPWLKASSPPSNTRIISPSSPDDHHHHPIARNQCYIDPPCMNPRRCVPSPRESPQADRRINRIATQPVATARRTHRRKLNHRAPHTRAPPPHQAAPRGR